MATIVDDKNDRDLGGFGDERRQWNKQKESRHFVRLDELAEGE